MQVGPAPPGGDAEGMRRVRCEVAAQVAAWSRGAPWTLQRLCELALEPRKQYSRFEKLVRLHLHYSPPSMHAGARGDLTGGGRRGGRRRRGGPAARGPPAL